jgi:hypothetical protein
MVEEANSGTSTNKHSPLELDTTTNLGTSRVQVKPMTCKSGALTLDGSRSSSILESNSLTLETIRFLMLREVKTLKDKQ